MFRRTWTAGLLALAILPATARAASVPQGFEIQPVILGPFDSHPVGFAFLPDGRIFLLEKNTGNVRLARPGSTTSITIHTIPGVGVSQEGGLLGVAVDPEWPNRPYVYFHVSQPGSVIQVLRYTGAGDLAVATSNDLQLVDPYIVLGDLPDLQGIHQGGTLRFGPDGYLYVSIGDDGSPCGAQDRGLLHGKILRIDVGGLPATGGGPPPKMSIAAPSNPFPEGGENEALVYAYGFRNPFRFTIDSATNDLFAGDVGENTYEEVDEIPYASPGGNFGWPEYEAHLQDPVAGAGDCSAGPFAAPIFDYIHPPASQSSVVCGPVVRPVVGSDVSFPIEYDGSLFVAEFYAGWIKRFVRGDGWQIAAPVPGQLEYETWGIGLPFISDFQIGPDGALYFTCLVNGGALERGLHRIVSTVATNAISPVTGRIEAFPNPLRPGHRFTVRYAAKPDTAGILRIFDVAGRLVDEIDGTSGFASWSGMTRAGRAALPGIYLYEMEHAGRRSRGKFTLLP